jgi:hypothetical protein
MTLCIGALAKTAPLNSPCVVLCFDSKVANDEFGSESEYKLHVLSKQLVALFSDRPGRAKELALIYKSYLRTVELTEDNVLEHLRVPIAKLKDRIANSYVQRCLARSYQDLLDHGDQWVGSETKDRYIANIEAHQLKVGVMIAGFIGQTPILCELRDGELQWATTFSLIGSGAFAAEPAMHARKHTFNTSLSEALYNTYEAKRVGETSPFVGLQTKMYVVYPEDEKSEGYIRFEVVTPTGEKFLHRMFRRYGPKPIRKWVPLPEGSMEKAFSLKERN